MLSVYSPFDFTAHFQQSVIFLLLSFALGFLLFATVLGGKALLLSPMGGFAVCFLLSSAFGGKAILFSLAFNSGDMLFPLTLLFRFLFGGKMGILYRFLFSGIIDGFRRRNVVVQMPASKRTYTNNPVWTCRRRKLRWPPLDCYGRTASGTDYGLSLFAANAQLWPALRACRQSLFASAHG